MLKEFMELFTDVGVQETIKKLSKLAFTTLRLKTKNLKDFDKAPDELKEALIQMIKNNDFNILMANKVIDAMESATNEALDVAMSDGEQLKDRMS